MKETEQEQLNALKENDDFKNVLEKLQEDAGNNEQTYAAEAIGAVEINVNTYYEDKDTKKVFTDDPVYGTETVTQLEEGKTLSFTVKVPADQYDADATYTVVRNHVNTDGTTSMDILETKQEGDVLTFASDKFSTFVIVEITEDESVKEENYVYTFMCQDGTAGDGNNRWTKKTTDVETGKFIASESCTISDITENSDVIILSTDKTLPVVIEKNLNKLNVSANAESVVTLIGNVADLTITDMAAIYDVKIEGDVGTLKIDQFHSGENNLTITGKVLEGITHSTRMPSMGFFECENMEIIQDGKWNSNLFIRANLYDKSVAYKPYQIEELESALDGLGLGEETTINTPTGSTLTAFKTASVSVSETKDEVFENLNQSEEMTKSLEQIEYSNTDEQKVLEATPIAALDINISTYFSPKGASSKYEEQEVTELIGDNKFAFTIKVPADQYDADAIYTVVRNHVNADGTTSMDVLETTQEGDVLTFASDKFSTFVIVELKANDKPSEPSEPSEPMEPIEPTEPSEPGTPSEPVVPSESQDSGDTAAEENVVDALQATTTTPTETGDVNPYVLPCIMLLGSIITVIVLARKEDLFVIR